MHYRAIFSYRTWKNVSIPLGKMPDDLQETLLQIELRGSVDFVEEIDRE